MVSSDTANCIGWGDFGDAVGYYNGPEDEGSEIVYLSLDGFADFTDFGDACVYYNGPEDGICIGREGRLRKGTERIDWLACA